MKVRIKLTGRLAAIAQAIADAFKRDDSKLKLFTRHSSTEWTRVPPPAEGSIVKAKELL